MKENGDDMEKLFQSVKSIIEQLPEQNRVLLQMLCVHLGKINTIDNLTGFDNKTKYSKNGNDFYKKTRLLNSAKGYNPLL